MLTFPYHVDFIDANFNLAESQESRVDSDHRGQNDYFITQFSHRETSEPEFQLQLQDCNSTPGGQQCLLRLDPGSDKPQIGLMYDAVRNRRS